MAYSYCNNINLQFSPIYPCLLALYFQISSQIKLTFNILSTESWQRILTNFNSDKAALHEKTASQNRAVYWPVLLA